MKTARRVVRRPAEGWPKGWYYSGEVDTVNLDALLNPDGFLNRVILGRKTMTHHQTPEGWFYVCADGTEVGPFKSEWEMFKYVEDIDINDVKTLQEESRQSPTAAHSCPSGQSPGSAPPAHSEASERCRLETGAPQRRGDAERSGA